MNIRNTDLSAIHMRALACIDDDQAHQDSVGARYDELNEEDLFACFDLINKGLVEAHLGWRGTFWFRLTERGRQVREKGGAK